MTKDTVVKIQQMRKEGQSYLQIASTLGISVNTIKSYCRRNNLILSISETVKTIAPDKFNNFHIACKQCGKSLVNSTRGQPRKFCSEECRRIWWKSNDSLHLKKAWYTLTCGMCGKEFKSYGNQKRKFCSHVCYIRKKFFKGRCLL